MVGLAGQRREVSRHALEQAVRLKLLQKLGSRSHGLDLEAAREVGAPVSLLSAPAHVACAEHTFLLMLAVARKLRAAHRAVVEPKGAKPATRAEPGQTTYNWAGLEDIGLLAGKTLGLVGMGDIAIEVAWRAAAFDMDVLYCDDEALPAKEAEELGAVFAKLDDLLIDSDIVSIHAARTPSTENLLDAEHLALMKPSAILINTARGGIVDERALAKALREGRLAGAGLDAWATEPPSRLSPLLKLDNVVATPHIAAATLPPTAAFETLLPNILAALRGEPLAGLLTPQPPLQPPADEAPPPADEEHQAEQEAPPDEPQDEEAPEEEEEEQEGEAPEPEDKPDGEAKDEPGGDEAEDEPGDEEEATEKD